jgi:hypothetical protein
MAYVFLILKLNNRVSVSFIITASVFGLGEGGDFQHPDKYRD